MLNKIIKFLKAVDREMTRDLLWGRRSPFLDPQPKSEKVETRDCALWYGTTEQNGKTTDYFCGAGTLNENFYCAYGTKREVQTQCKKQKKKISIT